MCIVEKGSSWERAEQRKCRQVEPLGCMVHITKPTGSPSLACRLSTDSERKSPAHRLVSFFFPSSRKVPHGNE